MCRWMITIRELIDYKYYKILLINRLHIKKIPFNYFLFSLLSLMYWGIFSLFFSFLTFNKIAIFFMPAFLFFLNNNNYTFLLKKKSLKLNLI